MVEGRLARLDLIVKCKLRAVPIELIWFSILRRQYMFPMSGRRKVAGESPTSYTYLKDLVGGKLVNSGYYLWLWYTKKNIYIPCRLMCVV